MRAIADTSIRCPIRGIPQNGRICPVLCPLSYPSVLSLMAMSIAFLASHSCTCITLPSFRRLRTLPKDTCTSYNAHSRAVQVLTSSGHISQHTFSWLGIQARAPHDNSQCGHTGSVGTLPFMTHSPLATLCALISAASSWRPRRAPLCILSYPWSIILPFHVYRLYSRNVSTIRIIKPISFESGGFPSLTLVYLASCTVCNGVVGGLVVVHDYTYCNHRANTKPRTKRV